MESTAPEASGFFPSTSLLETEHFPVEDLARLALREGQRKSPLNRVHRWFARRLGSAFRGLLAGATLPETGEERFWDRYYSDIPLEDAIVLDCFVGGGTSVIEAVRCGARVLGCDVDPVAAYITRFELTAAECPDLVATLTDLVADVGSVVSPFHRTRLEDGREAIVLHHFWVDLSTCAHCGVEYEAHPDLRLASDAQAAVQWVLCSACHRVERLGTTERHWICVCGQFNRVETAHYRGGAYQCPSCGHRETLVQRARREAGPPRRRLFAQEYLDPAPAPRFPRRSFKAATPDDQAIFEAAQKALEIHASSVRPGIVPERLIPSGNRHDARPILHGYRHYRELFNERQLLHLHLLGARLRELPSGLLKDGLCLAFSDHLASNCLLAAYATGYRRIAPLFSIQAFRHIARPVELNPWLDGIGRGTFPNAVRKVQSGAKFAARPYDLARDGGARPSRNSVHLSTPVSSELKDVFAGASRAAIAVRSALDLDELPARSVNLILTDPPYFDNVAYSELSDFYLAWLQTLGAAPKPYERVCTSAPLDENLAAKARGPEAAMRYRSQLSEVFATFSRVLRETGLLIFTYHHVHPAAWAAIGEALARSGLRCSSVFPLRGEGRSGLHSHGGTIKWDAAFVCRPGSDARPDGEVVVASAEAQRACEAANAWRHRLDKHPSLGFRAPDHLNLWRAYLAAYATVGQPGPAVSRLSDVVASARFEGGRE